MRPANPFALNRPAKRSRIATLALCLTLITLNIALSYLIAFHVWS